MELRLQAHPPDRGWLPMRLVCNRPALRQRAESQQRLTSVDGDTAVAWLHETGFAGEEFLHQGLLEGAGLLTPLRQLRRYGFFLPRSMNLNNGTH